jgi:hypothetical protein
VTERPCTFGCAPNGDRCGDLAPSNGLGPYLDQARTAAPVAWLGHAIIDTDAAQVLIDGRPVETRTAIAAGIPVEFLVVIAGTFEADDVTARGRRALAIVSDGDVVLHGTLSVAAEHHLPGAGASMANDPACTARAGVAAVRGTGGAGGGGFGRAGGSGGIGAVSPGGNGGAGVGNPSLVPLRGGCPGAYKVGTPTSNDAHEQPGAAGGAVQITTRGVVRLDSAAIINASGGGAKGDTQEPFSPICGETAGTAPRCNVGSGGGAGGAILIEARDLVVPPSAGLVANGGAEAAGTSASRPTARSLRRQCRRQPAHRSTGPVPAETERPAKPWDSRGATERPPVGAAVAGSDGSASTCRSRRSSIRDHPSSRRRRRPGS